MDKRYQVFVSSTYLDLKDERRKVIQALIEMGCIPAGMELFPAADEEQFHYIKRVIDDCDYYVLIIGGRYGTLTREGISYTEKEYDYAVGRGLKVVALIHENPDEIALGKSEGQPSLREKLGAFRVKVSTGRMVKHWKSSDELPGLVMLSLLPTINQFPAVGWIRASKAASEELLTEINELRKENVQLKAAAGEFRPTIENLAGLQDEINLYGTYRHYTYSNSQSWSTTVTWGEIFGYVSPYLIRFPNDDYVKLILASAGFNKAGRSDSGHSPLLNDQLFRTVGVQLQALGLVKIEYSETIKGSMNLFWSLTPSGNRLMMELRTVKSAKPAKKATFLDHALGQIRKNKEAK